MITGIVTAEHEAVVNLIIRGSNGQERTVPVVIDTGFTGWLTLPLAVITELELIWLTKGQALLANGQIEIFDVYIATLIWDREVRRVMVDAAETDPLLGMSLLNGYEMCIQNIINGEVTIQPILTI